MLRTRISIDLTMRDSLGPERIINVLVECDGRGTKYLVIRREFCIVILTCSLRAYFSSPRPTLSEISSIVRQLIHNTARTQ